MAYKYCENHKKKKNENNNKYIIMIKCEFTLLSSTCVYTEVPCFFR